MRKSCSSKIIFTVTGVLALTLVILSLFLGKYIISAREIFDVFLGRGTENAEIIVMNIRLPRTLMALVSGAALGLSGYVYQTIFDNPLASPDLIGVAGGANFGAALMIVLGGGQAALVAAGSFIGAVAAVLLVMLLAHLAGRGKISFILGGIIINAVSSSLIMVLKTFADPENELASIEYWEMGSLSAITWSKAVTAVIPAVLAIAAIFIFSNAITLMSLGDDESRTLGLRLKPVRIAVLGLNTLLVASVVSVTGLISFVGLIAPHIARLLYGKKGKARMLLTLMTGSVTVLLADILVREIGTTELPLSVLTAVCGVPVLIGLLFKRRTLV